MTSRLANSERHFFFRAQLFRSGNGSRTSRQGANRLPVGRSVARSRIAPAGSILLGHAAFRRRAVLSAFPRPTAQQASGMYARSPAASKPAGLLVLATSY